MISIRFVAKIDQDPRFCTKKKEFISKLSYTTAAHHNNSAKRSKGGVAGILMKLKQFTNNPRIFGYIGDVLIQPLILQNREASVVCFDGVAKFRNPHKHGHKDEHSPFPLNAPDQLFFDFAERVIRELRFICPELVADQILRVDFFGQRQPNGKLTFLVNEVEGLEARLWGVGVTAGDRLAEIEAEAEEYWYHQIETLIEVHLMQVQQRQISAMK